LGAATGAGGVGEGGGASAKAAEWKATKMAVTESTGTYRFKAGSSHGRGFPSKVNNHARVCGSWYVAS
jgi:hypothetical protein